MKIETFFFHSESSSCWNHLVLCSLILSICFCLFIIANITCYLYILSFSFPISLFTTFIASFHFIGQHHQSTYLTGLSNIVECFHFFQITHTERKKIDHTIRFYFFCLVLSLYLSIFFPFFLPISFTLFFYLFLSISFSFSIFLS